MREVGAFEAKTHLSDLLAAVESGEVITITRRGKAVAQLVPMPDGKAERLLALRRLQVLGAGLALSAEDVLSARDEGRR